jgi:predicted TIM-barrel fold metal-dependent hydrolase
VKHPFVEFQVVWKREQSHPAAYDPEARLALMDEAGVYAQVIYPNSIGLGGQNLSSSVGDQPLKLLCVQIYNDAMAELQEWSKYRFLPMPVMPAWSVDDCVRETERVAGLGMRGVNMTADPQDLGSPDLASRAWDPFWAVCADLNMPVHFHIGGSLTSAAFYGQYFWPSQSEHVKPGIGGSMHFINNARLVINTIWAGIFDRHPKLKMVPVESGIGWLPFIMETMDWELPRTRRCRPRNWQRPRPNTSRITGTRRCGSRKTSATCKPWSTGSVRTTSCSRPTSPIPPASIPIRWASWRRGCLPFAPTRGAR